MQSRKKKKVLIFCVVFTLVIAGIGGASFGVYNYYEEMKEFVYRDVIYQGITIHNIDVGNMSKSEALHVLQDYITEDNLQKELILYYEDQNWILTYEDWGFETNIEQLVDKAYQVGKEGTLKERYEIIKDLENEKMTYDLNYEYDEAIIEEVLFSINESFNKEMKDAIIRKEDGAFNITPEVISYDLDIEESYKRIQEKLERREEGRVELVVNEYMPTMTTEHLSHVESVLGSFYTTFSDSNPNRNKNLEVAADKMDGTLLLPGEVFSLMEAIGPVDSENGYYSAPIIFNGKLIPGVGGGVCQVATTLYNAVLNAELEIVERRNHSMPVGYVPLGQDATVSGDVVDFKFKNNTEYPLYIESYIKENKLYALVFGHEARERERNIKYIPVVIETIAPPPEKIVYDETLSEGQEVVTLSPKNGYRVKLYKEIYENDVLIETAFVDYSYYYPRAGEKKLPPENEEEITDALPEEVAALDEDVEEPIDEVAVEDEAAVEEDTVNTDTTQDELVEPDTEEVIENEVIEDVVDQEVVEEEEVETEED